MTTPNRTQRIADLMMRELSQILVKSSHDPRFAMVTISYIDLAPDLSHAKIYYTQFSQDQREETQTALNKAAGFLRSCLAKSAQLRATPRLEFYYDETIERNQSLSELIDRANAQKDDD